MAVKPQPVKERVEILTRPKERIVVPIRGKTELIVHRMSEKARKEILDRATGKTIRRAPKDPEAEYEAAFYRLSDGTPGFPVTGFKAAIISGAREFKNNLKMVDIKQAVFVEGDDTGDDGMPLVRIHGDVRMREDPVRVKSGGADLRYRPGFQNWHTDLLIEYNSSMISREALMNLINAAGDAGVGEWRPTSPMRSGPFGRFEIDMTKEIRVLQ